MTVKDADNLGSGLKVCKKLSRYVPELINSIEITIAMDIFGTIAIVKRISQLLLLLFIEKFSIDQLWNNL